MTTSTKLSGRNLTPKPPAKGSFPLDHLGECESFQRAYDRCVRENKGQAGLCREEVRRYLGCRMQADLMAKEDFKALGLDASKDSASASVPAPGVERGGAQDGFVAGMKLATQRARAGGGDSTAEGEKT